ncbi:phage portal protein [Amorphus orientalis]|uniref:Lambda family phage portal protein n=1 Tax=Amorphus orientalis TaxID=649198 RepID=A0AAE4AU22_9HYPH|nr:phage portal protein [Amorphus orientalis]MDQ0315509.1 lambda family phage portal protein [Amorphus orientalis]
MFDRLRKILERRSYDAAQGGRRWRGQPSMPAPVTETHAARFTLAARARYAVSNNPLAASGLEAWVNSLVGVGVKPQSRHPDPATRDLLSTRFERWTDTADADGLTDFYGLQASLVRSMIVVGEAFTVLVTEGGRLRVRQIDPDQVDASHNVRLANGAQIVQGVEFDTVGRRVAYHVFTERPGQIFGEHSLRRERIPAEDVVHLFRPLWPGQVRGLSWFAPILLRMADHDSTRDAQQVRQKVGAMLTGFVRSADGGGQPFDGEQVGGAITGGLEPGTIKYLAPGEEVVFSNPPAIGMDAVAFMRLTEREIAVGLGVPPYLLHGDLSDVNFSSIRAGLIAFRERVEALQHSVLVYQALRPIYERWATLEALTGRVVSRVEDATPAVWVTPRQVWVDPLKDTQAEILAISAGLKSRREAVASRGVDIEALDAEIATDKARADGLGLTFAPANDNAPAVADDAA